MSQFYRFRSIDSLLGKQKELETQSIYFANPKELNDPMEGFRNIYWHGDYIVWQNFFKHYLRCLERVYSLLVIGGEEHYCLSGDDLPIFTTVDDLPTDEYRLLFNQISKRFFKKNNLANFILNIANSGRKIRRDELGFYLQCVHFLALESISETYALHGLTPSRDTLKHEKFEELIGKINKVNFVELLNKIEAEHEDLSNIAETIFGIQTRTFEQMNLIRVYNEDIDPSAKNKNFVVINFPSEYLNAVEKLVFPDWYTACFMSECSDSAIWGHYGNNHTGICLVFESQKLNNKSFISIDGTIGLDSSGPIMGKTRMEFHPIEYTKGFGDIDFFRSIGRLPIPILESMWYKDENGEISSCAEDIFNDLPSWRSKYWENFYRDITRKTKDWSYENEHRLILASSINDYTEGKSRILKYDFSALKGLIFGINTDFNHKIEVMKIIEQKCRAHNRNDFKFYQASYSPKEMSIKHEEMSLLEFTNEE